MHFLFGVWFHKPDQLQVRNSLMQQIKESFERRHPLRHPARALHTAEPAPGRRGRPGAQEAQELKKLKPGEGMPKTKKTLALFARV